MGSCEMERRFSRNSFFLSRSVRSIKLHAAFLCATERTYTTQFCAASVNGLSRCAAPFLSGPAVQSAERTAMNQGHRASRSLN